MLDYGILLLLIGFLLFCVLTEKDASSLGEVIIGWIAQLGISSGAYYWKAKSENMIKLPIYMLEHLPEDMKEKADPNMIIESVLNNKD